MKTMKRIVKTTIARMISLMKNSKQTVYGQIILSTVNICKSAFLKGLTIPFLKGLTTGSFYLLFLNSNVS